MSRGIFKGQYMWTFGQRSSIDIRFSSHIPMIENLQGPAICENPSFLPQVQRLRIPKTILSGRCYKCISIDKRNSKDRGPSKVLLNTKYI